MIKLKRSEDGKYYYALAGESGMFLMTSEMYARKEKAMSDAWAALDIMKHEESLEVIDDTVPRKRSYVRKINETEPENGVTTN